MLSPNVFYCGPTSRSLAQSHPLSRQTLGNVVLMLVHHPRSWSSISATLYQPFNVCWDLSPGISWLSRVWNVHQTRFNGWACVSALHVDANSKISWQLVENWLRNQQKSFTTVNVNPTIERATFYLGHFSSLFNKVSSLIMFFNKVEINPRSLTIQSSQVYNYSFKGCVNWIELVCLFCIMKMATKLQSTK